MRFFIAHLSGPSKLLAALAAASLSLSTQAMEPEQYPHSTKYNQPKVKTIVIPPSNPHQNTQARSPTPSPRGPTKYSPRLVEKKSPPECSNNQDQNQVAQEITNIPCPPTTYWGNNYDSNKNQTDCHNNQGQSSSQEQGQCTGNTSDQGSQGNTGCQNSTPTCPPRPGANITPGVCSNHRHIDITKNGKFSLLSCDKDTISGQQWTGSTLSDCCFQNSHFENITISNATLDNIHFHGTLTHLNYDYSTIANTTYEGELRDVDFKSAVLTNVLFTNSTIKSSAGDRSSFDDANLINVWFEHCDLQKGINFSGVHFNNVSFKSSTIKDMKIFAGAYVRNGDAWVQLSKKKLAYVQSIIMHTSDKTITTNTDCWLDGYQKQLSKK